VAESCQFLYHLAELFSQERRADDCGRQKGWDHILLLRAELLLCG
jgi:hypothetical protein